KARALELTKDLRFGPLVTPPSLGGTITMPGAIGGAGWGGGAFDPTTGTIYIKATNDPALARIVAVPPGEVRNAEFLRDRATPALRVVVTGDSGQRLPPLPINKPPYGTLTAIDLNTGEHRWQIPV